MASMITRLGLVLHYLFFIWNVKESDAAHQFKLKDNYQGYLPPPKLAGQEKHQIWASINLRNIIDLSQEDEMISIEASLNLFSQ